MSIHILDFSTFKHKIESMKQSLSILVLTLLCFSIYGQQGLKTNSALIELETKILEENTDLDGVRLISEHRESLKDINAFKVNVINAYPEDMDIAKKNKKFRRQYINNEDYQNLQNEEKSVRKKKLQYLKSAYPNSGILENNRNAGRLGQKRRVKQ